MPPAIDIRHIAQPVEMLDFVLANLPEGSFKKILIKPNWVKHAEHEAFPIDALVTSAPVIEATIEACLRKYPGIERILVGDVPLQSCDWAKLRQQAGIDGLEAKYGGRTQPRIQFLDLRRERYRLEKGFLVEDDTPPGDPSGYVEAQVDERSQLEEVVAAADRFRVSDYDPGETLSSHRPNNHRYLIPKGVLESDLVINLPKMKAHQKMGFTGALKNLIGINGQKSRLCTHRLGYPADGGDEFAPEGKRIFYWQARIRAMFQKKSPFLFALFKKGWETIKYMRGIQTIGTRENLTSPNFYVGPGSWYGNDSIWRIVYDLHMVLLFAPPNGGALESVPQRRVLHVLDAITAGEGNGPLQPLPVQVGLMMASENPFLVDFCMVKAMGFDWQKTRALSQYRRFAWAPLVSFTPEAFDVQVDGIASNRGCDAVPVVRRFLPAPGWKGHIELGLEPAAKMK